MFGIFFIFHFKVQSVRIVAACISGHIPSENVLLFENISSWELIPTLRVTNTSYALRVTYCSSRI